MHLLLRYSISIITSIFTLSVVILVQEETSLEAKRKHNIARNELDWPGMLEYLILQWVIIDTRNTVINCHRGSFKTKRKAKKFGGICTCILV